MSPIPTFTIDPATGTVTFTPTDKSYTGKSNAVKVRFESLNGIKVDTTYTPESSSNTNCNTSKQQTSKVTQKGKPGIQGTVTS